MRALLLLAALAAPAAAQSLAERAGPPRDGVVRFSYAAREGVCDRGAEGWSFPARGERVDDWVPDCSPRTVLVRLTFAEGRLTEARSRMGGRWLADAPPGRDLGRVPAPAAAAWLLDLAGEGGRPAEVLIGAAALADSAVIWPRLLELARRRDLPRGPRRAATFWLGQAAGEAASEGLVRVVNDDDPDREIAKSAVFALSQRPRAEGVPALVRVARTHRDPEVRRAALFWLGQSESPEALALFEELLARP